MKQEKRIEVSERLKQINIDINDPYQVLSNAALLLSQYVRITNCNSEYFQIELDNRLSECELSDIKGQPHIVSDVSIQLRDILSDFYIR